MPKHDEKHEFIEFLTNRKVLQFGDFTLKSGRRSPYFFNFAMLSHGQDFVDLGGFFASCLHRSHLAADLLLGPAYKGIPAALSTAIALARDHGTNLPCLFLRKERKTHGEGGLLIGHAPPNSHVVIIDDVLSSGLAIMETASFMQDAGFRIAGMMVALDRQEVSKDDSYPGSAAAYLETRFDAPVISILTLDDILGWLQRYRPLDQGLIESIQAYQQRHGAPGTRHRESSHPR